MFLLQIQLYWVPYDVLYVLNLFHYLFLQFRILLLILSIVFLLTWAWVCLIVELCSYYASSHVISFILHTISLMNQPWYHSNACISFMHYSDPTVGERARWAHRVRRTRARCWVCGWARRNSSQAAKHDSLHLFNFE